MGYLNQILRAEQTLNKTQLAALDDLVDIFGVELKKMQTTCKKLNLF